MARGLTAARSARLAAARKRRYRRQLLTGRDRLARCNSKLFLGTEEARDLRAACEALDVGVLGGSQRDIECGHCEAALFDGECLPITGSRRKRGRSCCSDGTVVLDPVRKHARIDELWGDAADPHSKTLQKHACAFNNALALAYEQALLITPGGAGCVPPTAH